MLTIILILYCIERFVVTEPVVCDDVTTQQTRGLCRALTPFGSQLRCGGAAVLLSPAFVDFRFITRTITYRAQISKLILQQCYRAELLTDPILHDGVIFDFWVFVCSSKYMHQG